MAKRRKKGHFNVEPRYTPGSPAQVSEAIARKVAMEEKQFIEHALSGVWGNDEKKRAKALGLDLISFEMVERPKGWEVYDLITGKQYWWPHTAQCPHCKTKKVTCRRGKLESHYVRSGSYGLHECNIRTFVGHEVEVYDR